MHYGDITDSLSVSNVIKKTKPHEIYNLAAQSHVAVSFEVPEYTANADALGALRILEAIKFHKLEKKTKFYQAGTSEMYGKVQKIPQNEKTEFYPLSPYGVAKLYAHWITKNYREAYKIFACNGILFNHESPRRGETFVTKKIVNALCRIKEGKQKKLFLGNLNAKRDWGHARAWHGSGTWSSTADPQHPAAFHDRDPDEPCQYCLCTSLTTLLISEHHLYTTGHRPHHLYTTGPLARLTCHRPQATGYRP